MEIFYRNSYKSRHNLVHTVCAISNMRFETTLGLEKRNVSTQSFFFFFNNLNLIKKRKTFKIFLNVIFYIFFQFTAIFFQFFSLPF